MSKMLRSRFGGAAVAVLGVCALMPLPARASDQYRTFTDMQDRTFSGILTAFNATNEIVTIKRADGKTGNMPLSVFSESDRRYISNWSVTNDFMKVLRVAVQLSSADVEKEEVRYTDRSKRIKDFYYRIQLRNGSHTNFDRIDVEYCIFYRQGERDGYTILYDEGTCYGKITVAPLKPDTAPLYETKRVRLYSESGATTIFGKVDDLSTAEIRGIWLRLTLKQPSVPELVREYRTADEEIWKWTNYSIGAGYNRGDTGVQYILK